MDRRRDCKRRGEESILDCVSLSPSSLLPTMNISMNPSITSGSPWWSMARYTEPRMLESVPGSTSLICRKCVHSLLARYPLLPSCLLLCFWIRFLFSFLESSSTSRGVTLWPEKILFGLLMRAHSSCGTPLCNWTTRLSLKWPPNSRHQSYHAFGTRWRDWRQLWTHIDAGLKQRSYFQPDTFCKGEWGKYIYAVLSLFLTS